jgi:hypothetical protein
MGEKSSTKVAIGMTDFGDEGKTARLEGYGHELRESTNHNYPTSSIPGKMQS